VRCIGVLYSKPFENFIAPHTTEYRYNGHYVCAEPNGVVVADRTQIGPWETFTLIQDGNNQVSFQTNNGHYVCAIDGGGTGMVADRTQIGIWETFEFVYLADLNAAFDSINFSEIDTTTAKPDSSWQFPVQNPTNAEIQQTVGKTVSKASTFEFSFSETLTVGATAEFEADIPFIGSASTTISAELSLSANQSWTTTQQEEYSFSSTVIVPANTSVLVTGILYWMEDVTVPYTVSYWISAKDKNGNPMTNPDVISFIKQNGFSGTIVDQSQENRVLISLKGTLVGSWGTKTDIQSQPM